MDSGHFRSKKPSRKKQRSSSPEPYHYTSCQDWSDSKKNALDSIINKMLAIMPTRINKYIELEKPLTEDELLFLCDESEVAFLAEPSLLELNAPIKIVGDVHGQYEDLLNIFKTGGFPPDESYLFLGDYVDRGRHSIETISLLLALKIKYRSIFFLLRGNHESSTINMQYGFNVECISRYSKKVWRRFNECFDCMPPSAVLEKRIFCTHGGFSPFMKKLADVNEIRRPTKVPEHGLLCDLLWSDPNLQDVGWKANDRGVSYTYGPDIIDEKLGNLGIEMIVRAHQVANNGFEFFSGRNHLTMFSAPNYSGHTNSGAFLNVDKNMKCNFIILVAKVNKAESSKYISMTV